MRHCTACRQDRPLTEFVRNRSRPDGLARSCRACAREQQRRWREAHPEEARAASRRQYDPAKAAVWNRAALLRRYGLTEADVERMKAEQGGRCAICREVPRRWVIDHDHATGEVRALLCDPCNRGLGMLGEDPERLRAAAAYVEHHKAKTRREAGERALQRRLAARYASG